jgi:hypothetical protein
MGKYLDLLTAPVHPRACDISDKSDKSPPAEGAHGDFGRLCRFGRILHELERRCPDYIDPADWEGALADGRVFLSAWGRQAEALGWTAADLFGLAPVPKPPATNYRRLARYDLTGLIWSLKGRSVAALTGDVAAIQQPTGTVLHYRKHRKPPLGPLGDSLDDMEPGP